LAVYLIIDLIVAKLIQLVQIREQGIEQLRVHSLYLLKTFQQLILLGFNRIDGIPSNQVFLLYQSMLVLIMFLNHLFARALE